MFLLLCFMFWVYGDYKTQNRKSNCKQKTSLQSYKTQINIPPFPGLAQSNTEQPGQGATILGWPKSIYYALNSFITKFGATFHFFFFFNKVEFFTESFWPHCFQFSSLTYDFVRKRHQARKNIGTRHTKSLWNIFLSYLHNFPKNSIRAKNVYIVQKSKKGWYLPFERFKDQECPKSSKLILNISRF